MGNLVTQYIRRIAKQLPDKNIPEVAIQGTNHVDNPDVWNDKTIYKGEIAINVNTGKSYTSDGKEIVEIGKQNSIISGMQVLAPPAASAGELSSAIPLDLQVTSGFVRILGKKYSHTSVTNNSSGDVKLTPTTVSQRYDLIYAIAGTTKLHPSDAFYKIELVAVEGPSDFNDFYTGLNNYLPVGKSIDEAILLGIVYVPAEYDIPSPHKLRPWSWSCSIVSKERNMNLLHSQPYPVPNITPAYFIDYLQQHIYEHREANYEEVDLGYRDTRVYLEGQILSYNTSNSSPDKKLYKVLQTHHCISLAQSIASELITIVAGGGIGSYSGNYKHIPSGETITISADLQHFIYGDVVVDGTLVIDEQTVIMNGNLIINETGHVENPGNITFIEVPVGKNEHFYGNIKRVEKYEIIHIGKGRQNVTVGDMIVAGKLHVWGSCMVINGDYILEDDGEIILEDGGTTETYEIPTHVADGIILFPYYSLYQTNKTYSVYMGNWPDVANRTENYIPLTGVNRLKQWSLFFHETAGLSQTITYTVLLERRRNSIKTTIDTKTLNVSLDPYSSKIITYELNDMTENNDWFRIIHNNVEVSGTIVAGASIHYDNQY